MRQTSLSTWNLYLHNKRLAGDGGTPQGLHQTLPVAQLWIALQGYSARREEDAIVAEDPHRPAIAVGHYLPWPYIGRTWLLRTIS